MGEEGGDGSVERREVGRECLFKAQSKEGAAGWERGSQCSLGFLSCCCCVLFFCKLFFIYLGGEERERTSSRCVGVALKVVPMAHAATLTHGCTPAVPGGTVTYFS